MLPLEDLVFPVAGRYEFRITAKGRALRGPVLYLIEAAGDEATEQGPASPPT